jgi:hypothetical protein
MNSSTIIAMLAVGLGLSLVVAGWLVKVRDRDKKLAEILDLPFGERDVRVEALSETRSPLVSSTVGFAGKMVTQFDQKGSLKASLERARIPMKPGEYVVITACGSVALAALLLGVTTAWPFAVFGLALGPLGAVVLVRRRIARRRRRRARARCCSARSRRARSTSTAPRPACTRRSARSSSPPASTASR